MNNDDIIVVNEKLDTRMIKPELAELMAMVEAMLSLLQSELHNVITNQHQLWFVQILNQHMKTTLQLFNAVYAQDLSINSANRVFTINIQASNESLQHALVEHVHQLKSMCYLAAYSILDELDANLVNSLTVLYKYMKKVVRLVDLLELHSLEPNYSINYHKS